MPYCHYQNDKHQECTELELENKNKKHFIFTFFLLTQCVYFLCLSAAEYLFPVKLINFLWPVVSTKREYSLVYQGCDCVCLCLPSYLIVDMFAWAFPESFKVASLLSKLLFVFFFVFVTVFVFFFVFVVFFNLTWLLICLHECFRRVSMCPRCIQSLCLCLSFSLSFSLCLCLCLSLFINLTWLLICLHECSRRVSMWPRCIQSSSPERFHTQQRWHTSK